jgi:hypothetical protein
VRFEEFRFRPEETVALISTTDEEITFTVEELTAEFMSDDEVIDLGEVYPNDEGSPRHELEPLPGPDE